MSITETIALLMLVLTAVSLGLQIQNRKQPLPTLARSGNSTYL